MKKLLVNGAFSTGKTSLVHAIGSELGKQGVSFQILDDTARYSRFALNKEQGFDGTKWLIHSQIAKELDATIEGVDLVVVDRGIPDIISHYIEATERLRRRSDSVDLLHEYMIDWTRTYDVVITTPVNQAITIPDDGVRLIDPTYRDKMDQYNSLALSFLNCNSIKIDYTTQNKMDDFILLLKNLLKF